MSTERDVTSGEASSGPSEAAPAVESSVKSDSEAGGGKTAEEVKTLGVLLVHGIGSERRGDTLVQCATALHGWLRAWLVAPGAFGSDLSIDMVDTSVAEAGPDRPAHARVIFRRGNEIGKVSWLLAESCWFETYRRPGFLEFLKWALRVMPVAVVVHFLPPYLHAWAGFDASQKALKTGMLMPSQFLLIRRDLGSNEMTIQEVAQRPLLEAYSHNKMGKLLLLQTQLTLAMAAGLVVQVLLIAVAVLAVIPGITRSFAGWVQKKLSATLGDSYLFVTSPITGAAVATRVKKDLKWLAGECDRVIVLAHSQGAAVCYKVIEREYWGGGKPEKLGALVTYGSGLRKLFDLENSAKEPRLWSILCASAMVASILVISLTLLYFNDRIAWWVALPGVVVGIFLQMFPLLRPRATIKDPSVLRIPWHNIYSSHDPVPNGPLKLQAQDQSGEITLEALLFNPLDRIFIESFENREREVVNRCSIIGDHTSYWSSHDDFVARVVEILAKESAVPIHLTLDEKWLEVSAARRAWRVTWLGRCRDVAFLAMLSVFFWPKQLLVAAAGYFSAPVQTVAARLPLKLGEWWESWALDSNWILGAGELALGTFLMYLLASAGWALWERRERSHFFRRESYPGAGLAGWIFALGWIGIIAFVPAFFAITTHVTLDAILSAMPFPLALMALSAWFARQQGKAPITGTPAEWGQIALSQAEQTLASSGLEQSEKLRTAGLCFARSRQALGRRLRGTGEWVRAVVGEGRAIGELAKIDQRIREQAPRILEQAIKELKGAGQDSSEVESLLKQVQATAVSQPVGANVSSA